MRASRQILLIAVVMLGIGLGTATVGYAQSNEEARLSITKDVMDEIAHEQFAPVVARFSPDLKESLTADQIKTDLADLVAVTGAFQKQLSQDARIVDGMPIYVSRSQFEKFKVELALAFDDDNRITSVWFAPVSDLSPADMETSARALTDLLAQKNFDRLAARFSDRLRVAMPASHLDESWAHIIQHLGQFKSIKLARKDPEFDYVDVRCEFEHGEIVVRFAFDPLGNVDGLWMLPADTVDIPAEKAEL